MYPTAWTNAIALISQPYRFAGCRVVMSAPSAPKLTIERKKTFGMVVSSSDGSVRPASSTCDATISKTSIANAAQATVAAARHFTRTSPSGRALRLRAARALREVRPDPRDGEDELERGRRPAEPV